MASARARPPGRSTPAVELRRLVLAAVTLYAIGVTASLTHHEIMAVVLYSVGITVSALAGWLSRGVDSSGPPRGEDPVDEEPPSPPDGLPEFDWAAFEREFGEYASRQREPAQVR